MGAAAWPRSSAPAPGSLCCAQGPALLPPALEVLHRWEAAVGNTGLFWGYFGRLGCSSAKIRETNPAGQGRGRWCRDCFPLGAVLIPRLSGPGPTPAGTLRGALGAKPGRSSPCWLGALLPACAQALDEVGLGSGCPWGHHTPTWWAGSCVCPRHRGEGAPGLGLGS